MHVVYEQEQGRAWPRDMKFFLNTLGGTETRLFVDTLVVSKGKEY